MNKYISIALGVLAFAGLTACTEDKVLEVDTANLPLVTDYADNFHITVDNETNNVTFTYTGTNSYPVWIIDGKSYSASPSMTRYYRKAGDYSVEAKVGNANGVSQGSIELGFHVDKTMMSGFGGFNYDFEHNLWLTAKKQINSFFYAPGWAQLPDPSHSFDGETFSVTLPEATTDTWQAQIHIGTDICLQQGEHYDGSFIYTSNVDINQAVLKIHPDGDDDDGHSFFPAQKIKIAAGEPVTFWFSDLEAVVDMNNLVFTLDFGGNPAGAEISIENFVLKNHKYDDGTVLPELPTVPEPNWVGVDSPDNIWSTVTPNITYYYATTDSWTQLPDPTMTKDGSVYTLSLPTETVAQWQAQVVFNTDLEIADTDQEYDFHIAFESNNDLPAVTVKLTQADNDDNFFFAETIPAAGGAKTVYWTAKVKAPQAMPTVKLVLDFGGNPADTEVKISEIILQKHVD